MHTTDTPTRDEIAEAIGHLNATAKRIPHVVGTPALPTPWDRIHRDIDHRLLEWEFAER